MVRSRQGSFEEVAAGPQAAIIAALSPLATPMFPAVGRAAARRPGGAYDPRLPWP